MEGVRKEFILASIDSLLITDLLVTYARDYVTAAHSGGALCYLFPLKTGLVIKSIDLYHISDLLVTYARDYVTAALSGGGIIFLAPSITRFFSNPDGMCSNRAFFGEH